MLKSSIKLCAIHKYGCQRFLRNILKHNSFYFDKKPKRYIGYSHRFARHIISDKIRRSPYYNSISKYGSKESDNITKESGNMPSCPYCKIPFSRTEFVRSENGSFFVICKQCSIPYILESCHSKKSNIIFKPPSPTAIVNHLNKYVVGQNLAKKVLAVAVYNHYKRLVQNKLYEKKENDDPSQNISELNTPMGNMRMTHKGILVHEHLETKSKPIHNFSASYDKVYQASHNILDSLLGKQSTPKSIIHSHNFDHNEEIILDKSNIIMFGPTGCGKTFIVRTLAKFLNVPFALCDCTTLTQAGYVGEDVESIFNKLLIDADYDIKRAEQGIIFLDEVDKIGCIPGVHQLRDVGGEGVQQAMLKLLEGTNVQLNEKISRKIQKDNGNSVINTANILFIASGAFNGVDKIVAKRKQHRFIGFNSNCDDKKNRRISMNNEMQTFNEDFTEEICQQMQKKNSLMKLVEAKDLVEYGMIPEFIGRFPVIVPFDELDLSTLENILVKPKSSLLAQYRILFQMDKVDLQVDDEAICEIAKLALQKKMGARGLRSILERLLLNAMYDVAESNINRVVISKDVVNNGASPQYYRTHDFPDRQNINI